jgi:hypothetical protein
MVRQPIQQQQQRAPVTTRPCPTCKQVMRLVGRESAGAGNTDLLTFQCHCGQIIATMTH